MHTAAAAALGVAFLFLLLLARWKWRSYGKISATPVEPEESIELVHTLCPHNNVVQSYAVDKKDSLDEHLDALTKKLAEKEGRLRISKSKIRETHKEMESLHALDNDVRMKYRDIMTSLRRDLMANERECKNLQTQIEWVSRRRAELHEQVFQGQQMYGMAASDLALSLAELQKYRANLKLTEKPYSYTGNSWASVRNRREPIPPKNSTAISLDNESRLSKKTPLNLSQASSTLPEAISHKQN